MRTDFGFTAQSLPTFPGPKETTADVQAGSTPQVPTGAYRSEPAYSPLAIRFAAPARTTPADTGFAADARGTGPQWELDHDLALLCEDVYNTEGPVDVGSDGWSRLGDDDLFAAGIDPASLDDPQSGFRAGIYTDGEGRYVVAFAGSREGNDWIQNLQQGVGLPAEQYDQAVALAQQAAQAFGTGNLVFTGHSLGGGLASAAALAVDDSTAVTFNAAGLHPATFARLGLNPFDADVADDRIRRYNVENEVLTGLQEDFPQVSSLMSDAVGYEITLENPGNAFENPLSSHGMDAVLAALESRDVKLTEGDGLVTQLAEENTVLLGGHSLNDVFQTLGGIFGGGGETVPLPPDTGTTTPTTLPPAPVSTETASPSGEGDDATATATPPNTTTTSVPPNTFPGG